MCVYVRTYTCMCIHVLVYVHSCVHVTIPLYTNKSPLLAILLQIGDNADVCHTEAITKIDLANNITENAK